MYEPRRYWQWIMDGDLVAFRVAVKETDLYIRANRVLGAETLEAVIDCRDALEGYIEHHPAYASSLLPVPAAGEAPWIVRQMADVAMAVGVGPMAAVAGAIAEEVGRHLMKYSSEVLVENGGDIFMASARHRRIGIYAGDSPFTGRLALDIDPERTPIGVCTSSGTVGHSLSFGRADAAIVLSHSTALADAAATAIGNVVKKDKDIGKGIKLSKGITGIEGVVIIKGDKLGVWGDVHLAECDNYNEPQNQHCGSLNNNTRPD